MAGLKLLKRKVGVNEISDDFSDFSLSSPATKIRRLDAGLPPIVEEEEPSLPLHPHQNEERALVLFKPLPHSPSSSFSLTLDSDLLSEIKNQQIPWSQQRDSDCDRLIGSREHEQDKNDHRLAIVPWVPQPSPSSHCSTLDDSDNAKTEMMEADEMGGIEEGEGMMDIEQEDGVSNSSTSVIHHPTTLNLHQHQGGVATGFTANVPEGFQQQHCLLSQLPQNTSTPVTWTR
ncbi:hypothetical protein SESBI_23693 [Sesbania bispinosa]|nr:hypothetical protein SESBI_23693 [Sesbania bispinosa]